MTEYIDKDAALETTYEPFTMSMCVTVPECKGMNRAREMIFKQLRDIPAADVVDVWHGEWVLSVYTVDIPDIHRWHEWHCSNCGYVRKAGWEHTEDGRKPDAQYCEHCMAKMDGGVNDGKAD